MCAYEFKMFIFSCFYCYQKTAAVKPCSHVLQLTQTPAFFVAQIGHLSLSIGAVGE